MPIRRFVAGLSPRIILVIGLAGILLYAYPGYMSFDSVRQLAQTRWGVYTDDHPPAMAALWRVVELFVTGPFGMLLIQDTTFLIGAYLLFETRMSARAAAVAASLVMWMPLVSNTMAVIWKDSQMSGFLLLGAGLLLSPRLRVRIAGLACLAIATAMRHNALAMTLPIVVLLFTWNPAHRFWRRYAISVAAWLAITLSAQFVNRALTTHEKFLWHQSLALLDMVGTLRHVTPDLPDPELHQIFDGTSFVGGDHIHERARAKFGDPNIVETMWAATWKLFERPTTQAERDAIGRAWKSIVLAHPLPYLAYRWQLFRMLIQITDVPLGSPSYIWFHDVQRPEYSALEADHDAAASRAQDKLHYAMVWFGSTWMFHVYVYLILALLLLPLCIGDRQALALLLSGLSGEAALFFLAPTTDLRYSFWLMVATSLTVIMLVARRMKPSGQSVDEARARDAG